MNTEELLINRAAILLMSGRYHTARYGDMLRDRARGRNHAVRFILGGDPVIRKAVADKIREVRAYERAYKASKELAA